MAVFSVMGRAATVGISCVAVSVVGDADVLIRGVA